MSEYSLAHNLQPTAPTQETLNGGEIAFDAASIPMEWPKDLGRTGEIEQGTELHALIGLGSPAESGKDQITLLRTPAGQWAVAGVRPNRNERGNVVSSPVAIPVGETPMLFGRRGDSQPQSGIMGGSDLHLDPNQSFSSFVSGIHLMVLNDGSTIRLKDGSAARPSSNHTFVTRIAPEYSQERDQTIPIPRARLDRIQRATPLIASIALPQTPRAEIEDPKEIRLRSLFMPKPDGPTQAEMDAVDDAAFERRLDKMFSNSDQQSKIVTNNYLSERQSEVALKRKEFNAADETIANAVDELNNVRSFDTGMESILAGFDLSHAQPEQIVRAIRTDPSVRLAVGKYYLGRIRQLVAEGAGIPLRVRLNGQKNPDNGVYPQFMTSQEYVALLCVAKLDGTFDKAYSERLKSDLVERNTAGEITQGQHRYAAALALHTRM